MTVRLTIQPSTAPLGERGEMLAEFTMPLDWRATLTQIPGVIYTRTGVRCTLDAAYAVAAKLDVEMPLLPVETNLSTEEQIKILHSYPGFARFQASKASERIRPYQLTAAAFLAYRRAAMCCDEMRLGKTFAALTASMLRGGRTFIVSPAAVKYVWAEENARWFDRPTVILEGLSGTEGKVYCPACAASAEAAGTEACALYQVEKVCPSKRRRGKRKLRYLHKLEPEQLVAAMNLFETTVANYDILVPRQKRDARGTEHMDSRLAGWARPIAQVGFSTAIGDEFHRIRGWVSGAKTKGRREMFNMVTDPIPAVWGLTGTPVVGRVKNLWAQLDSISRGAMTSAGRLARTPFAFDAYYCEGQKIDGRGWYRDGCAPTVESELTPRRRLFTIARSKRDVWDMLPQRQRSIVRIDPPSSMRDQKSLRFSEGRGSAALTQAILATTRHKIDTLIDQIVDEALSSDAGSKLAVFAFNRESVRAITTALNKALAPKEISLRARVANFRYWALSGEVSAEDRKAMSRAFIDHDGAGIVAATLDSVPEGISLRGAQSMHFLDLHWNPNTLLQIEERPLEYGVRGVTIIYYVVIGSVDEHIYDVVVPKIEHILASGGTEESRRMQAAFESASGQERNVAEIILRMAGGMDDSADIFEE